MEFFLVLIFFFSIIKKIEKNIWRIIQIYPQSEKSNISVFRIIFTLIFTSKPLEKKKYYLKYTRKKHWKRSTKI